MYIYVAISFGCSVYDALGLGVEEINVAEEYEDGSKDFNEFEVVSHHQHVKEIGEYELKIVISNASRCLLVIKGQVYEVVLEEG